MKKLLIFTIAVTLISILINAKINASSLIDEFDDSRGFEFIGVYETYTMENHIEKVYISEEIKNIYDSNNIDYYVEQKPIRFLWFVIAYHYSYYIYDEVTTKSISQHKVLINDLDSLIYMIRVLENMAYDYLDELNKLTSDEDSNKKKVVDLVVAYIRCINKSYYSDNYYGYGTWDIVAGVVDINFINYVYIHDMSNFKIRDYFAFFCDASSFNNDVYVYDGNAYLGIPAESTSDVIELAKGGKLVDPINNNYKDYNLIDLIHMFATIDGTNYSNVASISFLVNHFQRDLSGWAGDLQTFCKIDISDNANYISSRYVYFDTYQNYCNRPKELKENIIYNNYSSGMFDNFDMLADIDAMNITKFFLDPDITNFYSPGLHYNLLSTGINAYYNFVNNDNGLNYNRYKMFIDAVAIDYHTDYSTNLEKFEDKVYISMALKKESGLVINYSSFPTNTFGYYLLDGNNLNNRPSYDDRKYVAELFINYIYEMSTPPIIDYEDLIEIDCSSNLYEDYISLDDDEIIRYPINVLCETTYKLKASSQLNEINIILYNEDGTIYNDEPYVSVNGTVNTFILDLDVGSYYLELYFVDESDGSDIEVEIGPYIQDNRREILLNQTTDVLEHMHDGISKYKFMRANGDYYNMQIIMQSYDSEINPTCEVELINTYNNDTITYNLGDGEAQNNQYIYNIVFKADSLYMINIDFSSEDLLLNLCTATITNLDEISLDTLGTYEYEEDIVIGDKVNYWNVLQNSVYEITIEGRNLDDVLFVVLKKNGNNFINLYSELASGSYYLNTDFELNQGDEIYIGYLNGNGTGSYEFTIERAISNSFHLVTDIDNLHTVGSEVTLNNGSYGGTTIMQGFTRVCYLDIDCPYPNTRLDYNWYSSDESVAKVSTFGTVTATCLWQENVNSRQVTITAVYKYDYTVIGTIILTVYKDTSSINDITYLQYGMDVRDGGTISGTEVTSGLGSTISVTYNPTVTIHANKTRLICLGLDSPTSSIQDYTWTSSNDYYAQVSSFGTIFANNSGTVTISGINKYNSRYRVSIIITII